MLDSFQDIGLKSFEVLSIQTLGTVQRITTADKWYANCHVTYSVGTGVVYLGDNLVSNLNGLPLNPGSVYSFDHPINIRDLFLTTAGGGPIISISGSPMSNKQLKKYFLEG